MPEDCSGTPCHQISFATADLKLERWQVNGDLDAMGQQRVYGWPDRDDPLYLSQMFDPMRAPFDAEGQRKMAEYTTRPVSDCGKCHCVLSTDPKDAITVKSRVSVNATYNFADGGGVATLFGSFELSTTRTNGLCAEGEPIGRAIDPPQDLFIAAGYSAKVIELITGKKPGGRQQKQAKR
jgi:hypothetical protein